MQAQARELDEHGFERREQAPGEGERDDRVDGAARDEAVAASLRRVEGAALGAARGRKAPVQQRVQQLDLRAAHPTTASSCVALSSASPRVSGVAARQTRAA